MGPRELDFFYFKSNTLCTDLYNSMRFKIFKKINPIGQMKSFIKSNFNLCIEEFSTLLNKYICEKCHTSEQNLKTYGICRQKIITIVFY